MTRVIAKDELRAAMVAGTISGLEESLRRLAVVQRTFPTFYINEAMEARSQVG